MPSAAYFRRQADICLRLALIASDEEVSNRLIMMAREYSERAESVKEGNALGDEVVDEIGPFMSRGIAKFSL